MAPFSRRSANCWATPALVRVQGAVSQARCFTAGVRQGCPLSPLLHNVMGEAIVRALHAWDRGGLGVHVGEHRLVANQYADDVPVCLKDQQAVLRFVF